MSWTLTTSAAAIVKAGANANSTITASGAALLKFSEDVEGMINTLTKKDWISGAANTNFAGALSELASNMIAMKIIAYDMSGYTSRAEAQTMLDVLDNDNAKLIKELRDIDIQDFIT